MFTYGNTEGFLVFLLYGSVNYFFRHHFFTYGARLTARVPSDLLVFGSDGAGIIGKHNHTHIFQ